MKYDFLAQQPFTCKFDWGVRGTERAVLRGDTIVLVDTLSFSSATVHAVARGAVIYPCAPTDDSKRIADEIGGELAVNRKDVPARGRYSLSPKTYEKVNSGQRIVLPSLNGGTCSRAGAAAPYLIAGALVNATAVGRLVSHLVDAYELKVTVIACGEREHQPAPIGDLRVAIEDYLAAGAIIAAIESDKSAEARVCEAAFVACTDDFAELIRDSASGRELGDAGFEEDVRLACRKDSTGVIPVLCEGAFVAYTD